MEVRQIIDFTRERGVGRWFKDGMEGTAGKSVQWCTPGLGGRAEEDKIVRSPVREKARCQL